MFEEFKSVFPSPSSFQEFIETGSYADINKKLSQFEKEITPLKEPSQFGLFQNPGEAKQTDKDVNRKRKPGSSG